MLHDFVCPTCHEHFQHRKPDKIYCSRKCWGGRHPSVTFACGVCGVEKTVPYRFRDAKYCSTKCAGEATAERLSVDRVTSTCEQCKEPFDLLPRMVGVTRFCSRVCHETHVRGGLSAIIALTCEGCGAEFQRPFVHRASRFCSRSCANSGEHNGMYGKPGPLAGKPAWNHGLTADTDERVRQLGRAVSVALKTAFAEGHLTHKGEKNPAWGRTRDTRSSEQLERYSKAAVKRVVEGKSCRHSSHVRGNFTSAKTCKTMSYRSSYELRLMLCFDRDVDVVDYDHESIVLQIEAGRRYIPDFIVRYADGRVVMIEAKPVEFIGFDDVVKKSRAAVTYCTQHSMSYMIMTGQDIECYETRLGFDESCWRTIAADWDKKVQAVVDVVD